MNRAIRNAPYVLLGAMLVASGILTIALTWDLTYFGDSWAVLMRRRDLGVDEILLAHNEHIAAGLTIVDVGLLELFGMDSARPEFVIHAIALLVVAALLFTYVKRCIGPWPAVMAAGIVLFLGPAWEVLLWPFELAFCVSIGGGLGALLLLERMNQRSDLAACLLLVVAVSFSSLGIPFLVAAAVEIFMKRRERSPLQRAYVFLIPVVLFGLWYLGWGADAGSHLSLRNILASPRFVVEVMAVGMGSLFGLGPSPYGSLEPHDSAWGAALLVVAAVGVAVLHGRRPGFHPGLWPVAAAAATNWFLIAFNYMPARDPAASRYVYATAIFLLLIGANLLRGVRFGARTLLVMGAVTIAAISVNLVVLKAGQEWFRDQTTLTRADTAAIEIARDSVDPGLQLYPEIAGTASLIDIFAGSYLEAVDEYGSPAYTPEELEAAPEAGRKQADIILSQALPLSTVTTLGQVRRRGGQCVLVEPGAVEPVTLAPGLTTIGVEPGATAQFNLRRFATEEFPVQTEGAPGGSTTALRIPTDRAERPWQLQVVAEQRAYVCAPTS